MQAVGGVAEAAYQVALNAAENVRPLPETGDEARPRRLEELRERQARFAFEMLDAAFAAGFRDLKRLRDDPGSAQITQDNSFKIS